MFVFNEIFVFNEAEASAFLCIPKKAASACQRASLSPSLDYYVLFRRVFLKKLSRVSPGNTGGTARNVKDKGEYRLNPTGEQEQFSLSYGVCRIFQKVP